VKVRRLWKFRYFLVVLLLLLASMPARAQTTRDLKACQVQNALSHPDRAIPACTAFISSGRTVDGRPAPAAALSSITLVRGLAHFVKEEYKPAISDFTLALPSSPDKAAVLILRARAHLPLKDFSSAMEDISRAIQANGKQSDKPAILYARGFAYFMQHDYEPALSDLNAAIALNPRDASSFFIRAELYQYKGEDEKAAADYTSAMKLDPSNAKMFAGYREFEGAWRDYLKDIQETNDYANWSVPPLNAYRGVDADKRVNLPKADSEHNTEAASCDLAAIHWRSVEAIGTLAAYEDHLGRFPNCAFATLAKARIAALKK
jgi:tetratricopeptide (TPR) repeat protein